MKQTEYLVFHKHDLHWSYHPEIYAYSKEQAAEEVANGIYDGGAGDYIVVPSSRADWLTVEEGRHFCVIQKDENA